MDPGDQFGGPEPSSCWCSSACCSHPWRSPTPRTRTRQPRPPASRAPQAVLTDQLDASGIPGGAVVVVHDGTIEARGVGDSGHGDVTGDTPFVLGSASKSFTALAVMQLVDAGQVDLDAPVRDYVPEFELAEGQPIDDITVRDILAADQRTRRPGRRSPAGIGSRRHSR